MKYSVTVYEDQTHRYVYEVDADSKEGAEEMVRRGDCDPIKQKLVDSQTVNVEVEELK